MAGLSIAGDADVGSGQWLQIAGIDQTYTVGGVQGIGINAFPQNTLSEGALFLNYTDNIPTQVNKVFITRNAFFQHTLNIENVLIAYRTSEGSGQFRTAFSMEGATDVVAVANRAPNGIVEIRANNATGGGGGEATIATFSRPTGTSYSQLDLNTDVLRLASSESNSTAGAGISTIDIRVANGQTKTVRFSSANGGIASNAGGVLFFSSINHLTDADKHIHGMYMLSMANFTQVAQLTTIIERLTGGTWSFTKTAGIAQVDFAFASTGGTMAIALWYIGVGDASWTLL